MSAKEIYDFVSTVTPDYAAFLAVAPQKILTEVMEKNQEIHLFDDGTERVISLDDDAIIYMVLEWSRGIPEGDAGRIMDFYLDSSKANAMARSFKFTHPEDGHIYVVKFRSKLQRSWAEGLAGAGYLPVSQIKLKVIGRIAD